MIETQQVPGWTRCYSGKVRDLFTSNDRPDEVLVVASDRVSAFDHVLSTPIPDKGKILTAMSLWWFERLEGQIRTGTGALGHHVLSTDVPAQVAGRAMLCRRLTMVPVECVARGYLTGSGLADSRATGVVCGNQLRAGLQDGSRLDAPIFTPATKAALGDHDENVDLDAVACTVGRPLAQELRDLTLAVYAFAEPVARDAGILLADTKLELGNDPTTGELLLGDEVLTPDSSRFWPAEDHEPGRAQPSFDKQVVRDWLTSAGSGWDRAADTAPPALPDEVVERTRERYFEAFRRLTGRAWS